MVMLPCTTRSRGTFGVKDPALIKMVERRLNWYKHIERRDEIHLLQKVNDFEVACKRRRGRPKRRLRDCDRRGRGTPEMAQDHAVWKQRMAEIATLAQPGPARTR